VAPLFKISKGVRPAVTRIHVEIVPDKLADAWLAVIAMRDRCGWVGLNGHKRAINGAQSWSVVKTGVIGTNPLTAYEDFEVEPWIRKNLYEGNRQIVEVEWVYFSFETSHEEEAMEIAMRFGKGIKSNACFWVHEKGGA
jgi:hypothetical protein